MARPSIWDQRLEARLTHLWCELGQSASMIGKQFLLSRNAVIGKVHRMNLPMRTTLSRDTNRARPKRRATNVQRVLNARIPPPHLMPVETYKPVGKLAINELTNTTCRFPVGNPQSPDFKYCGSYAPQQPYCPSCAAICFNGIPSRKPKRELIGVSG